jgi:hypothetical protein
MRWYVLLVSYYLLYLYQIHYSFPLVHGCILKKVSMGAKLHGQKTNITMDHGHHVWSYSILEELTQLQSSSVTGPSES